MNEILNILLSVAFGSLGYFITNFWISPVLRYRSLVEKIHGDLVFHANTMHNPQGLTPHAEKTSDDLRRNASGLRSLDARIFKPTLFRKILRVPNSPKIKEASGALVGMSNSVFRDTSGNWAFDNVALHQRLKIVQDNLDVTIDEDLDQSLKNAVELYYGPRG